MSDTDINNVYADIERIADFHISPPKLKTKKPRRGFVLIYPLRVYIYSLQSQTVVYKNNMYSVRVAGVSRYQKLAADGVRGLTVVASAGFLTGCFHRKSLGICGRRYVSGTLHGAVQIVADLIHAYNKNNLFRTLRNTGNPVGIAVNIH